MNYTLHQLQVFSKVVQVKSITKASAELFMTQPAVSIQLRNFQDQFDIPLTEVIGRKLHITEFGMEIYKMAENIIAEMHAINFKTQSYKGLLTGRLSFAIVSTGKYVMPYYLSDFMKKHLGVELVMDVTNKSRVVQSVLNNTIDFALVSILPEDMNINEEILLENELCVVANKQYKLSKKQLTREDLKSLPLIFRETGSGTRSVMESFFNKNKITVLQRMELTSNEAVKQAVLAGLGLSIMPLIGIRNELRSGELKIIPTIGLPIKTKWRLIWLKEKNLSPVAKAFIEFVQMNKASIEKKHFKPVIH
ncbi:MAG TPA: LysR family transcriptional regulator [Bacteroidia bacterium]|nr:LysR family transcriptional regulator [Bacteroidia bacterium]